MSRLRTWSGIVVGAALFASCGGERGGTAAGDAASSEVAALNYEVTPERYQRWVAAQQTLDAIPGLPVPPKIDPLRPDEAQVQRAVEYLEGNAQARAALARAGISARDYVLTTVALDQALVAASSGPASPGGATGPTGPLVGQGTKAAGGGAARAGVPGSSAPGMAPPARAGPQLTGTPPANVELVRRNRDDVVRVLRTMRFRISEPAADVVDTTVTRSDSVTVGKDVTVKWDITVRRNRDSAAARKAARDSTRPDSTKDE
jgi:hypothetical protein